MTSRSEDRSPPSARMCASTPAQIVGTPPATVTCSSPMSRTSVAGCRSRSGMIRAAPDSKQAKARPHALAWNMGTTGSTRSRSDRPKAFPRQAPIECR